MKSLMSPRNLSLGLATAAFLLSGSALAQSSSARMHPWQLTGVNARLNRTVDTQSARQGQRVAVKLDSAVKTANGTRLAKGTEVWGKVEKVQASQDGGPSSLTLRFTTAELKNGQKVPVKVTVIEALPRSAGSTYLTASSSEVGPAPKHISPQNTYTQEPGTLHNITMKSAVQSRNSATFSDSNGNVKLNRGTYLQLAIAPLQSHMQQNGM